MCRSDLKYINRYILEHFYQRYRVVVIVCALLTYRDVYGEFGDDYLYGEFCGDDDDVDIRLRTHYE